MGTVISGRDYVEIISDILKIDKKVESVWVDEDNMLSVITLHYRDKEFGIRNSLAVTKLYNETYKENEINQEIKEFINMFSEVVGKIRDFKEILKNEPVEFYKHIREPNFIENKAIDLMPIDQIIQNIMLRIEVNNFYFEMKDYNEKKLYNKLRQLNG